MMGTVYKKTVMRNQVWLIVLAGLAVGCRMPPTRPVWLADSSGVILQDEYYDLSSRQTRKLAFSLKGGNFDAIARHVHPQLKSVVEAGASWSDRRADLTFSIYNLTAAEDESPLHITASIPWEGDKPADFSLERSPKGNHLLLCLGHRTAVYNLDTRQINILSNITPPGWFERYFGMSPCRPDNGGFLAAASDGKWTLSTSEDLVGRDAFDIPFRTFLRHHTHPVFVTWDGSVTELDGMEAVRSAETMFAWMFVTRPRLPPETFRFIGDSEWRDGKAVFSLDGERLEFDTVNGSARHTRQSAISFEKILGATKSAELRGGTYVVQVRPLAASASEYSHPTVGVAREVAVLDKKARTERILDASRSGEHDRFLLYPSPERKFVLVMNGNGMATPNVPSGILIDERGEVVTTLGIGRDDWEWATASRLYGISEHWRKQPEGASIVVSDALSTTEISGDTTLQFMAHATGTLAKLKTVQHLALIRGGKRLTVEGLQHLKHFPKLRHLELYGFDDDCVGPLGELQNLRKLSGSFSESALEQLTPLERLQTLELSREGAGAYRSSSMPAETTAAGIRSLVRHPHLRELVLFHVNAEQIAELPKLLNLRQLNIQSVDVNQLQGLHRCVELKSLKLFGRLSKQDVDELAECRNLSDLVLYTLNLTLDDIEPLSRLDALTRFELHMWIPSAQAAPKPMGETFKPLAPLTRLTSLKVYGVSGVDADLQHLYGLTRLGWAHLGKAQCSENALMALSSKIPAATIHVYVGERSATYKGGQKRARY